MELEAILHGEALVVALTDEVTILGIDVRLERQGGLRLVIDVLHTTLHHLDDGLGQLHPHHVHTDGMRLKHSGRTIDVHHETGQAITFPMHQTIGVVESVVDQSQAFPEQESLTDTFFPERLVRVFPLEGEDAHSDGAHLVVTRGEILVAGAIDVHHIPLFRVAHDALDGAREDPRVETEKGILLLWLKKYFCEIHLSRIIGGIKTRPGLLFCHTADAQDPPLCKGKKKSETRSHPRGSSSLVIELIHGILQASEAKALDDLARDGDAFLQTRLLFIRPFAQHIFDLHALREIVSDAEAEP